MSEANFDKRLVERKIKRGVVDQKEYDNYMSDMEDCSELAETIETKFIRKIESKEQEVVESDD